MRRSDDGRHAVVQRLHDLVCGHDDDTAALQAFSFAIPVIPETGQNEHIAVTHTDAVGDLPAVDDLPLVEAVRRNEAASMFEGGAIGRLFGHEFDPGIDGGIFGLRLLRPMRDQVLFLPLDCISPACLEGVLSPVSP